MERTSTQRLFSRVLHFVGDLTARSSTAALITLVVVVYGVLLIVNGIPGHWESAFQTIVGAVTLVMLFVIQHTQSRQQIATQLKLDELILASPRADDLLVKIENSEDSELIEREQNHVVHHEALREPEEADKKD